MVVDVAVVGAGPAGLAVAVEAAARGLATVVLERRADLLDKACGEGLMPAGAAALRALGALPGEARPFVGIRWLQEDGTEAAAAFPAGNGLGVRRVALAAALRDAAAGAGAALRLGCGLRRFGQRDTCVELDTDGGALRARLLVAADGLASPVRLAAGLDGRPASSRRFGVRRHYACAPWSDHVEIHWAAGAEAYVTPVGARCVGVALLWDEARLGPRRFDALLQLFPRLRERLVGQVQASADRGAGPLARAATARRRGRVVLVGDAGGYVDAISGEGISLAFAQAAGLGPLLAAGCTRPDALVPWEQQAEAAFRRYARLTGALLLLSRHPALRRQVIRGLAASPWLFAAGLGLVAEAARAPALPALR